MKAQVKEWMADKLANELSLPRLYHLEIAYGIKETEKAIYALFYVGYNGTGETARSKCSWIPKSAIENIECLEMITDYEEALKKFHAEWDM